MQEVNHLAMNCGRGFELGITETLIQLVVTAGLKLGDNAPINALTTLSLCSNYTGQGFCLNL